MQFPRLTSLGREAGLVSFRDESRREGPASGWGGGSRDGPASGWGRDHEVQLPAILALLSPLSLVAALRHSLLIANGSLGPWVLTQGPLHGCALLWVQPQCYNKTSSHHEEHPWVHRSAHADCWFVLACIDQHWFQCCWWTWARCSVQRFWCQDAIGWFAQDSEPWASGWCTCDNKHIL